MVDRQTMIGSHLVLSVQYILYYSPNHLALQVSVIMTANFENLHKLVLVKKFPRPDN